MEKHYKLMGGINMNKCINCGKTSHYAYCDDCQELSDNLEENGQETISNTEEEM